MFRRAPQSLFAVALSAWIALHGGRVHAQAGGAQSAPAATDASQVSEARNHFVLGMQLFEARSFRDALREFELAAALAPSADVWFNIGRAHEELGEYARAARAFERYLRDRVDAQDAATVKAHIAELDQLSAQARAPGEGLPETGSLRIHSRSKSSLVLVLVDGQALSRAALDEPLLLKAGRHRLDVSEAGYIPMHAQLDVEPGLLTAAYADLQPATRVRTLAATHGLSWSLLGLTAAGVLTSGTFAALALSRQADGDVRRASAWAERTDVALVGTGVCALAAVVLYYIEGRHARTERRLPVAH
jgi:tetratricopeptide (TPR) repeat protein